MSAWWNGYTEPKFELPSRQPGRINGTAPALPGWPMDAQTNKRETDMTSNLFAPDGCVIPNIRTELYAVTMEAKCEHTKIRQAVIIMDAISESAAWNFAATYLRMPQTEIVSVIKVEP
jgi:hypothetical protein